MKIDPKTGQVSLGKKGILECFREERVPGKRAFPHLRPQRISSKSILTFRQNPIDSLKVRFSVTHLDGVNPIRKKRRLSRW